MVAGPPTPANADRSLPCGFSVDSQGFAAWSNCSTTSQRIIVDINVWPDDEICVEWNSFSFLGKYSSWWIGRVAGLVPCLVLARQAAEV
jgi:hypothetical protein